MQIKSNVNENMCQSINQLCYPVAMQHIEKALMNLMLEVDGFTAFLLQTIIMILFGKFMSPTVKTECLRYSFCKYSQISSNNTFVFTRCM